MRIQSRKQIRNREKEQAADPGLRRGNTVYYRALEAKIKHWQDERYKERYEYRRFYTENGLPHYYELYQNDDGGVNMSLDGTSIQVGSRQLHSQEQLDSLPPMESVSTQAVIRHARSRADLEARNWQAELIIPKAGEEGHESLFLAPGQIYIEDGKGSRKTILSHGQEESYPSVDKIMDILPEGILLQIAGTFAYKETTAEGRAKAAGPHPVFQENGNELAEAEKKATQPQEKRYKAALLAAGAAGRLGGKMRKAASQAIGHIKSTMEEKPPEKMDMAQSLKSLMEGSREDMEYLQREIAYERKNLGKLEKKLNSLRTNKILHPTAARSRQEGYLTKAELDTGKAIYASQERLRTLAAHHKQTGSMQQILYDLTDRFSTDPTVADKDQTELGKAVSMIMSARTSVKNGFSDGKMVNFIYRGQVHCAQITGGRSGNGQKTLTMALDGEEVQGEKEFYKFLVTKKNFTNPSYAEQLSILQGMLTKQIDHEKSEGKASPLYGHRVSIVMPDGREAAASWQQNLWTYSSGLENHSRAEIDLRLRQNQNYFEKAAENSFQKTPEGVREYLAHSFENKAVRRNMDVLRRAFGEADLPTNEDRVVFFYQNGELHTAAFLSDVQDGKTALMLDGAPMKESTLASVANFRQALEEIGNGKSNNNARFENILEMSEKMVQDREGDPHISDGIAITIPGDQKEMGTYDRLDIGIKDGKTVYHINGRDASREDVKEILEKCEQTYYEKTHAGISGRDADYSKFYDAVREAKEAGQAESQKGHPPQQTQAFQEENQDIYGTGGAFRREGPESTFSKADEIDEMAWNPEKIDQMTYMNPASGVPEVKYQTYKDIDQQDATDPFLEGFSINETGHNSTNAALLTWQINCDYFDRPDPSFDNGAFPQASMPFTIQGRFPNTSEHEFRKYMSPDGTWKVTDVLDSSHGQYVQDMDLNEFQKLLGQMTKPGSPLYSKRTAMEISKKLTAGDTQARFITQHRNDPMMKNIVPAQTRTRQEERKSQEQEELPMH